MRSILPVWCWLAASVAMVVALAVLNVLLPSCAGPQDSSTGEEDAGVEVESQIVVVSAEEAATKRARAHEALVAKIRASARPSPMAELQKRMADAIIRVQPWYSKRPRMAHRLAGIILDAAIDHAQSPWIALAMAYKESSLSPGVGRLEVTGELGEEGYFQIMPRSYPLRACGKGRSMGNARANADTAMCYLSLVRSKCSTDDPWQYVSAYGMRECPSPGLGRKLRPSIRGRSILCRMVGEEECGEIWPS